MFECLILGDSIAKGVSDIRKECKAYVKSGINSSDYNHNYIPTGASAQTAIISLGSNDMANIDTEDQIRQLRNRVQADRVYWILPNIKERVRKMVWTIARERNDSILDARNYDRSPDTIHPTYTGYKDIAKDTK
jgi:hypothetical protein